MPLALRLTLLALMCSCAGPAWAHYPPGMDTLPIAGWWAPPIDAAQFNAYRKGGFNLLLLPAALTDAKSLALANDAGLRVMVANPQQGGGTPETWVAAAQTPTIVGWLLEEQAGPEKAASVAPLIKQLKALDADRWPIVTLPSMADPKAWGRSFGVLQAAGMPVLCLNQFSFLREGDTDESGFYRALQLAGKLAGNASMQLWGMVQVTAHGEYRQASESDMRVQAYSYLAAGAKGLCYFTYWGPAPEQRAAGMTYEGWGAAMIDTATGRFLYGYDKASELNREITALSRALKDLRPVSMRFVGTVPKSMEPLQAGDGLIKRVVAERALVAYMTDGQERPWAMIINRRFGKQKSAAGQAAALQVFLDPRVSRVTEVSRMTGEEEDLPIRDGHIVLNLPGGTGALLRLEL